MRVGIGYDIHRLVRGRKLRLGGVLIPYPKGLLGHSDGDALLHAVADALLGASGLGDLGAHFPDSAKRHKNADSLTFLRDIAAMLKKKKLTVLNVDAVVILEAPKLSPYREPMERAIAASLGIPASRVNVKAKTNEGLGPIGKGKAIAAQAIAGLKER